MNPHPHRSDWFISKDLEAFRGVPGVVYKTDDTVHAHRTHLPLIFEELSWKSSEGIRDGFDEITSKIGWKLRRYQHDARDFILSRKGTLLADRQRMGKSWEVASSWRGNGPCLIVAPLAVRPVWMKCLQTIHPNAKIGYVTGKTFDLDKYKHLDGIFCHYDILARWGSFSLKNFELVAFDEVHVLCTKNRKSKRLQGAEMACQGASRIIGATGTPLWNNLAGVYNVLNLINLSAWGSYSTFTGRYASGHKGDFGWVVGDPSHTEEMKNRLKEVLIRREWEDVVDELPQVDKSIELVGLTRKEHRELDSLQNIVGSAEKSIVIGAMARMRKKLGDLKIKTSVDVIKRFLQSEENIVVWVWHKDVAYELSRRLQRLNFPVFVSTSEDNLSEVLDQWEKEDQASVLILTIGVGQVGIDLSKSRHCLFVELDYTPSVVDQARYRTYSPMRPSTETYIVADHPVDYKLVSTILKKCEEGHSVGLPSAEGNMGILSEIFEEEGTLEELIEEL